MKKLQSCVRNFLNMKKIAEINGLRYMTKIYDFDFYRLKKEERLRASLGIDKETWIDMKEHGYDPTKSYDREEYAEEVLDG